MSVSGRNIDGCLKVCKIIDDYDFPFIEINISCAHSSEAHGFITRNSKHISLLVKTLKKKRKNRLNENFDGELFSVICLMWNIKQKT